MEWGSGKAESGKVERRLVGKVRRSEGEKMKMEGEQLGRWEGLRRGNRLLAVGFRQLATGIEYRESSIKHQATSIQNPAGHESVKIGIALSERSMYFNVCWNFLICIITVIKNQQKGK